MEVLNAATQSRPKSAVGVLIAMLRKRGFVEHLVVCAGAGNRTVKATAKACGIAPKRINPVLIPAFDGIDIDCEERTAMKYYAVPR